MTDDLNGWRAGVRSNVVFAGLEITLGRPGGDRDLYVTAITSHGMETELIERYAYPQHVMHLQEDAARALYDALAEHFGNSGGGRQLRADYNHERGRVDKLIGTLSTIATEPRATA